MEPILELTSSDMGLALVGLAMAVVVGLIAHVIVFRMLPGLVRRMGRTPMSALDPLRRPSMLLLPLLGVQLFLPVLHPLPTILHHIFTLLVFAALIWLVVAALGQVESWVKSQHDVTASDNLEARRIHTQVSVLTRSAMVIVILVGTGAALMTFPNVRALGTAMLASAGLAGLVVGFAARPVLENLIAGLQIALTQPIRLDDVVIIEGEWGRIEEITMTYVVVGIWDQRRLVVPLSQIIGKPFQNWTRRTSDLLGTVFLHVDYTVPVAAVRAELERLCESSDLWDGKVCVLQVTDATERTVQLRALVSTANSGDGWELRTWVREKLIDFLQREYPDALPRARIELPPDRYPDETEAADAKVPEAAEAARPPRSAQTDT